MLMLVEKGYTIPRIMRHKVGGILLLRLNNIAMKDR
jgi:hypothetical protein